MVRSSDILTAFASLVGWRQPTNAALPTLSSSLTNTTSGLYFNELSELVSADILNEVKPVSLSLQDYLTRITNEAISSVVDRYMVHVSPYSRSLVLDETLYKLDRDLEIVYQKETGIAGIWVKPVGYKCLTVSISEITLEFVTAQTVNIYVQGEDGTIISTHPLEYTNAGRKQAFQVNIVLPLDQQYRIGYRQEEVTGQAIVWDCMDIRYEYVRMLPFYAKDNISTHNYGLNIKYSLTCDLTSFFIKNKLSFARALQLQVGITAMRAIQDSTNVVYVTQSDAARRAEMLQVDFETRLGINPLSKEPGEFDKIKADFSGIDPVCLPRVNTPLRIQNLAR